MSKTYHPLRGDIVFEELIRELESLGQPKLASKWAKRFCEEGLYHHGAWCGTGSLESHKPYEEEFSCWNCDFRITRVTTVKSLGRRSPT